MFESGFGQNLLAPTLESDLRCLSDWQRRYLPNLHSPLGQQMLAWLIKNKNQPKPFSHLLVSTSFSPTSVRHLLNQFVVLGLVEVRKAPVTRRRGDIVATPKLQERLEEYTERIKGIISHHRGTGLSSAQSVRAIQKTL
jgi:DNA-binding MarR family transcriptional regulator